MKKSQNKVVKYFKVLYSLQKFLLLNKLSINVFNKMRQMVDDFKVVQFISKQFFSFLLAEISGITYSI